MSLSDKKPEEKSLTEKLVDKKGTSSKGDILTIEEQIVKCKANKKHKKNRIAQLTRKGRYTDIQKMSKQNRNKKRRKKLGLNINRESPERKMRDKIRNTKRRVRGLKSLK